MTIILDGDEWYLLDDGKPLAPFVTVDTPTIFDLIGRFVGIEVVVVDELEGDEWHPAGPRMVAVSRSIWRELLERFPERKL